MFHFTTIENSIPIYLGAANPVIPASKSLNPGYYGKHGFGDVFKKIDTSNIVQSAFAANAMYSLAKKHPGEITFICVGTLTNLALGMSLYTVFPNLIKDIAIMGGNYTANINSFTGNSTDWNFFSDPEAAHIVFNRSSCDILLLPTEISNVDKFKIDVDWRMNGPLGNINSKFMNILNIAEKSVFAKNSEINWSPADAILVATFLVPEEIIIEDDYYAVNVELKGDRTRGQLVLDKAQGLLKRTRVVKSVKSELFKTVILKAAQNSLRIKIYLG